MQIARVSGDLTATQKHPSHEGKKILLVQPLDLDGSDRGNPIVAVDSVGAGVGNRVLLVQDGFAAFTSVGMKPSPIDAAVIAVIDEIHLSTPREPVVQPVETPPAPARKKKAGSKG
jgi:microcompartment protein CcmK/EutM